MEITKNIKNQKTDLLKYFRNRSSESLAEIRQTYGTAQHKKQASEINKSLNRAKKILISILEQEALKGGWSRVEKLEGVLLITYTNYIVMLESRNDIWPYEYMAFSRRIGELWEPFCKLCFDYSVKDISRFVPPLFSDVKKKLSNSIERYINKLDITDTQKKRLLKYYQKVWVLVNSGEVKLELDLHFILNKQKYVIDFKSGFGSNEKGNTNRLLLVASIYKNLEQGYKCLLFVRADENNNYFDTLKNSGIWEAYSGTETYDKIMEYSGFDIKNWINSNVNWELDFKKDTLEHLQSANLMQYLIW